MHNTIYGQVKDIRIHSPHLKHTPKEHLLPQPHRANNHSTQPKKKTTTRATAMVHTGSQNPESNFTGRHRGILASDIGPPRAVPFHPPTLSLSH